MTTFIIICGVIVGVYLEAFMLFIGLELFLVPTYESRFAKVICWIVTFGTFRGCRHWNLVRYYGLPEPNKDIEVRIEKKKFKGYSYLKGKKYVWHRNGRPIKINTTDEWRYV